MLMYSRLTSVSTQRGGRTMIVCVLWQRIVNTATLLYGRVTEDKKDAFISDAQ